MGECRLLPFQQSPEALRTKQTIEARLGPQPDRRKFATIHRGLQLVEASLLVIQRGRKGRAPEASGLGPMIGQLAPSALWLAQPRFDLRLGELQVRLACPGML